MAGVDPLRKFPVGQRRKRKFQVMGAGAIYTPTPANSYFTAWGWGICMFETWVRMMYAPPRGSDVDIQ